jgi:ABC-2 type transport system permease protein
VMLAVLPLIASSAIFKSPNGTFAVLASLFPTASPFLMQLRLSLHPGPPVWQVALSVLLVAVTTVGCVAAAGKIFRIGILSQGKSASFAEMLRWLRAR